MRERGAIVRFALVGAAGLAGMAGMSVGTLGAGTVAATVPTRPHVSGLMQVADGTVIPTHGGGTVESLNWSGYAVTPANRVTAVDGSFIVPSAGLLPPGFAATWMGVGGFEPGSTDLIQAGVAEDSLPNLPLVGPQYYAWYEMLPNAETPLTNCTGDPSCTVVPGDHVAVAITEGSAGQWTITMSDTEASGTTRWTFSKTVAYASSGSSAEWILEAPQVAGLQTLTAPVTTAHFGPTSTFTAGGAATKLADGDPTTILQNVLGVLPEATPSAIAADGQSFNVCTYASSCPTP